MRLVGLVLAIVATLAFPTATSAGERVTRMVDDDGRAAVGDCDAARETYRRIQRAVDVSGRGDRVLVCPGIYTGPVIFGPGDGGVTLKAATAKRPIIRASRERETVEHPWGDTVRGVVDVDNVHRIKIRGFRLRPLGGPGTCDQGPLIAIRDGSAVVVDNRFQDVAPFDASCSGYSLATEAQGEAVRLVFRYNVVRDADVSSVSVLGQSGSTYAIEHNRIVWRHVDDDDAWPGQMSVTGATGTIAHNFIRTNVSTDATLRLDSGATVERNILTNTGGFVVFDGAKGALTIRDNVLTNVSEGIIFPGVFVSGLIAGNVLLGAPGSSSGIALYGRAPHGRVLEVLGNVVSGFEGGIFSEYEGSVMRDNDFRGNRGLDCADSTTGDGTSGTANIWRRNLGSDSDPRGICHRSYERGQRDWVHPGGRA